MATNAEKYPDLWKQFCDLREKETSLLIKSAPAKIRLKALRAQLEPLEAEYAKVQEEIKAIERPDIFTLRNQIAGLARAMGGHVLHAEPPRRKGIIDRIFGG